MKTRGWIWQFDADYPGPDPNDGNLPMGEAWKKTHNGIWWMGDISAHPLEPRNANDVRYLQGVYEDQGIGFVPWCVPQGHWPEAEADIAIEVLKVTGKLVLDVEPYEWFWTGPWANLHPYMQRIRAAVPDAWICICIDPRYGQYGPHWVDKYADVHFDEWLPYIDSVATMDYWDDFGVDPVWQIDHTWARLKDCGKEVIFTLPAVSPVEKFRRGLARAVEVGAHQSAFGATSIWRRGGWTADNIEAVRDQELSQPGDPCQDIKDELELTKSELAALKSRVRLTATELDGVGKRLTDEATRVKSVAQALRDAAAG